MRDLPVAFVICPRFLRSKAWERETGSPTLGATAVTGALTRPRCSGRSRTAEQVRSLVTQQACTWPRIVYSPTHATTRFSPQKEHMQVRSRATHRHLGRCSHHLPSKTPPVADCRRTPLCPAGMSPPGRPWGDRLRPLRGGFVLKRKHFWGATVVTGNWREDLDSIVLLRTSLGFMADSLTHIKLRAGGLKTRGEVSLSRDRLLWIMQVLCKVINSQAEQQDDRWLRTDVQPRVSLVFWADFSDVLKVWGSEGY